MIGILFLALAIVASSGVAMTIKAANSRGLPFGQLLAINYLVATLLLLISGAGGTSGLDSAFIWALGVFVGCMYVLSLWLFDRAIEAMGLALPTALMRLSAILPTIGSLIIFKEQLTLYQMLGLILAFSCLPLASTEPIGFGRGRKSLGRGIRWGLILFLVYGLTDFMFKVHAELAPASGPNAFMIIIFGTALLLTISQLFKGARPGKQCLFWGFILGMANVLATYFWIRALTYIPGSLAYPTLGIGVIAVTTLAGLMIWHEKLRPANYAFLVMAGAAVFLINLG